MQNIDHRPFFERVYDTFKQSQLFTAMTEMVENNDWHLEANVGVHTEMVVDQYMSQLDPSEDMTHEQLLGALACMLHDIGKPVVCTPIIKEDGTTRLTSRGHELESARLAEDYLVTNFNTVFDSVLSATDIFRVCWLIQNHLFYTIKKTEKLRDLRTTSRYIVSGQVKCDSEFDDIFIRCITADALGRIGKDDAGTKTQLEEWIAKYESVSYTQPTLSFDAPTMTILIGPSGVGKSTFRSKVIPSMAHYSFDAMRLEMFSDRVKAEGAESEKEIYTKCWELAESAEYSGEFRKLTRERLHEIVSNKLDVVIDNTNLSTKARTSMINDARQKGYQVVAVLFPISIEKLVDRLQSRRDRDMDPSIVINMYKRLTLPSIGKWIDGITVWDGNLWNTKSNSKN